MHKHVRATGGTRNTLLILLFVAILAPASAFSQTIDAIRVGDYADYTHVCIELSKSPGQVLVIPKAGSNPQVQIKIRGGSSGKLGSSFTAPHGQQTAFSRMSFATDARGDLIITIPVSEHIDLSRLHWHKWSDMITLDLPYIVPLHPNTPTDRELRTFLDSGGKVVIIDAGHGGHDPGAVGGYAIKERVKLQEKDMVLDIAQRLDTLLSNDTNFLPILTRYGDYMPVPMGLKGSTRKQYLSASLSHRVKLAQQYHGSVLLSLHLNAPGRRSSQYRVKGYEVYYQGHTTAQSLLQRADHYDSQQLELVGLEEDNDQGEIINILKNDNVVRHSLLLATALTDKITLVPGITKRPKPILSARFRMLMHVNMPTVLLEYLFITNPAEHRMIGQPANRQHLAAATHQGLRNYFFPSQAEIKDYTYDELAQMAKVQPKAEPTVPTTPTFYTVKRGDSLSKIAQRYGVSLTSLRSLNRGKLGRRDRIYVGQKLQISTTSATARSAPAGNIISYTVRSGDTLGKIALRYKTTISSLRALNNLRGSTIYRGQKLKVMSGNSSGSVASAPRTVDHRVQRGDTLYDLAVKYGTTTRTIMRANNLRSSSIQPGQQLSIPLN